MPSFTGYGITYSYMIREATILNFTLCPTSIASEHLQTKKRKNYSHDDMLFASTSARFLNMYRDPGTQVLLFLGRKEPRGRTCSKKLRSAAA